MRLSTYSDYSLRVLMYAGLRSPDRVTVEQVASTFGISRHHLVKIVHHLGRAGLLVTVRGVGGGFTLARPPREIRLGDVVRMSEGGDGVMDCTGPCNVPCRLLPACHLKELLDKAAAAFFSVLDRHTLADLLANKRTLRRALGLIPGE